MRNIRSNTIVKKGWEEGEGMGKGEGVLKLKNAGCLLYFLLLTTKCFSYQRNWGIGARRSTIPVGYLDDPGCFFAKFK